MDQLIKELKGKYPKGCASDLEEIERILQFDKFDSYDALSFGNFIVQLSRDYAEEIVVLIIREKDQIPIFQFVANHKKQRNIHFAMAKRETVLLTGHCSLWAMAKHQSEGGLNELFNKDSKCLPVGGAYPIYVNNDLIATVALSGLHEGLDHQLIIDALCMYLGKSVPKFTGKLI